jgi:hypothetical protein
MYQSRYGAKGCIQCGKGTYQDTRAAAKCKVCPVGTFNPTEGAMSLTACRCVALDAYFSSWQDCPELLRALAVVSSQLMPNKLQLLNVHRIICDYPRWVRLSCISFFSFIHPFTVHNNSPAA